MKHRSTCFLAGASLFLLVQTPAFAAARGGLPPDLPRSPEALRSAVEQAYRTHDLEALRRLVCWDGVDSAGQVEWTHLTWWIEQEVDSVALRPLTGHEFREFTNPEGVHYSKNLELLGTVAVTMKPIPRLTGMEYGRRDSSYLMAWFAPVDTLPPPELDPLLTRDTLTPGEMRLLDACYAGSEAARDSITEKIRYLSHPNPTAFLRAERFMLLMLRDALDPRRPADRARELRKEPVRWDLQPQGMDLARFYLDEEPDPEIQAQAIGILYHLKNASADSVIVDLIESPRDNAWLTQGALELAGDRGLRPPRAALVRLADRSSPETAKAARELNNDLGYPLLEAPPPGDFLRSQRGQRLVAALDSLAVGDFPQDAPFVELQVGSAAGGDGLSGTIRGWVVRRTADSVTVAAGNLLTFALGDTVFDSEGNPLRTRWMRMRPIQFQAGTRVSGGIPVEYLADGMEPLDSDLRALCALRWMLGRQMDSVAVVTLSSLLDRFPRDDAFLQFARETYGRKFAEGMFDAWSRRDLPRAGAMARVYLQRYPGTSFAPTAARILEEIPLRRQDFAGFTLPTVKAWEAKRRHLSRKQRVDFLCERLRLITGSSPRRQRGPIFGTDTEDEEARPGPEVRKIRPSTWLSRMGLSDVALMIPYLLRDRLTYSIDYDHIETTSKLLAEVINRIADQSLCEVWKWDGFTAEEREQQAEKVSRWVRENKSLTEQERILKRVHEAKAWREVPEYRFDRLTPAQRQEALLSATRFIDPKADAFTLQEILFSCLRWAPAAGLEPAETLLGDREPPDVQALAGLLVAGQGDREQDRQRGLDAVASALARGTYGTLSSSNVLRGVESLLAKGTEPRYREAAVVFDRDYFSHGWESEQGPILVRFADAHRPDPYRWLLAELADSTEQGSWRKVPLERRDWAARLAVRSVIPREAGLEYGLDSSEAVRNESREKIRAWLQAKLAGMTGGD